MYHKGLAQVTGSKGYARWHASMAVLSSAIHRDGESVVVSLQWNVMHMLAPQNLGDKPTVSTLVWVLLGGSKTELGTLESSNSYGETKLSNPHKFWVWRFTMTAKVLCVLAMNCHGHACTPQDLGDMPTVSTVVWVSHWGPRPNL